MTDSFADIFDSLVCVSMNRFLLLTVHLVILFTGVRGVASV